MLGHGLSSSSESVAEVDDARAMATRCCSPPDRSVGRFARSPSRTGSSAVRPRSLRLRRFLGPPLYRIGSSTRRRAACQEVVARDCEAGVVIPQARPLVRVRLQDLNALQATPTRRWPVEATDKRTSPTRPQAEGASAVPAAGRRVPPGSRVGPAPGRRRRWCRRASAMGRHAVPGAPQLPGATSPPPATTWPLSGRCAPHRQPHRAHNAQKGQQAIQVRSVCPDAAATRALDRPRWSRGHQTGVLPPEPRILRRLGSVSPPSRWGLTRPAGLTGP
jgi:hypothetical protein